MTNTAALSREELANSLSHGVGFVCALIGTPILILSAVQAGGAAAIVGSSVFGASLILLYLASAAYHASSTRAIRARLRKLDHAAIFLLIAGTYTPFTLGVLAGPLGWTLFGLVWGTAALGVCFKFTMGMKYPRLSTAVYMVMGWLVIIAIRPLALGLPTEGLLWLVAGGLAYTAGVGFYNSRRIRYAHLIWHLFVLAGSVCHYFAVLWYAA